MDKFEGEDADGNWMIIFDTSYVGMMCGPSTQKNDGVYIELTDQYKTLTMGSTINRKKTNVNQTYTFTFSVKEQLKSIIPLMSSLHELNRNTAQAAWRVSSSLFQTIKAFKPVDKSREIELSKTISIQKTDMSDMKETIDKLHAREIQLSLQINTISRDQKRLKIENDQLIKMIEKKEDQLIKMIERQEMIERQKILIKKQDELNSKKIKKVVLSKEQEIQLACTQAKKMAEQQKEAKERLIMLQHDYSATESIGSILIQ